MYMLEYMHNYYAFLLVNENFQLQYLTKVTYVISTRFAHHHAHYLAKTSHYAHTLLTRNSIIITRRTLTRARC